MPRRKGDKNKPRIGGQSCYRGERLVPQAQFAFNVNENIFNLARQMCRCHSFWPEGYPMPGGLGCFDRIPCRIDRDLVKNIAKSLLSRNCHKLDSFISRFKGHVGGLANVNIRGRCDNVFYSEGACTCIISGYQKNCLESIIPGDALPLVLKPDGQPADFYPDSVTASFPQYHRENGQVYPYVLPEGYRERNLRACARHLAETEPQP